MASKIWDLVFRHFGELTALDFALIALFTLAFAFAIYRFFDWLYTRRLEAQEHTIDSYKRLGLAYREERDHLENQNRELRAAAKELEQTLVDLRRDESFTRERLETALGTLFENYIGLLIGYRVALQMNVLAQFLLVADQLLTVYAAVWSAERDDLPNPRELRASLDGVVERFRPFTINGAEGLPEVEDFQRVMREKVHPPDRILKFPGDELMAPVIEVLAVFAAASPDLEELGPSVEVLRRSARH